ncbi:MAG: hypothetical protein Q4G52_07525 [Clostridia bacterium]|nr:hypothetical protein [Clostridia bacterium]
MLNVERDRNVKKTANLSFVLLVMLGVVVSAFAYAVLYKLLEGWALRDVLAAVVGVCMILLGIAIAWMCRTLIVQAGQLFNRIERLSETIEEKLMSLPAQAPKAVEGKQSYLAEGDAEERTPEQRAAVSHEPAADEGDQKTSPREEKKPEEPLAASKQEETTPHAEPKKPREEQGSALHALGEDGQQDVSRQAAPLKAMDQGDDLPIDVDELPDL